MSGVALEEERRGIQDLLLGYEEEVRLMKARVQVIERGLKNAEEVQADLRNRLRQIEEELEDEE